MAKYSQQWHNGTSRLRSTETSDGLAVIQAQLNNLVREIKKVNEKVYAAQVTYEQCKGPHYTKDCPLKEEGKTLKEAYYTQFGGPFQGGGYRAAASRFYQRNNANPSYQEQRQYMEDTLSKFMRASVSVMTLSTNLNLGLGELAHIKLTVELADRIVKYPKGIAKTVLVERKELDLEARLMGETLVINRSLDPLNGDYIELYDLNEPFELRRNQGDYLMPTIMEGMVIEEFRTRNDELDNGIVLEDMDAYRDEGMGDVIFGEPFLREVGIKARSFKGMNTIYNGNDEVTYQMVRSHPRFKHHTNEQCNKIPPLLKVSDEDKKNEISHPYQKLKGFYKGVLNLGPDYIRDAKTEEWLTCGHISVHEVE
ncbi:hypothetical protein Tco_0848102 [Tanacetum coccineum]